MGPSVSVGVELYNRATINLKNRGVKVKYVTEINKENIHYCKDLMKMIDELRHLDGVKGNSAISETEYLTTVLTLCKTKNGIIGRTNGDGESRSRYGSGGNRGEEHLHRTSVRAVMGELNAWVRVS